MGEVPHRVRSIPAVSRAQILQRESRQVFNYRDCILNYYFDHHDHLRHLADLDICQQIEHQRAVSEDPARTAKWFQEGVYYWRANRGRGV